MFVRGINLSTLTNTCPYWSRPGSWWRTAPESCVDSSVITPAVSLSRAADSLLWFLVTFSLSTTCCMVVEITRSLLLSQRHLSCRDWRQCVRWGGADVWQLKSGWRQGWRELFFFNGGSPFFEKKLSIIAPVQPIRRGSSALNQVNIRKFWTCLLFPRDSVSRFPASPRVSASFPKKQKCQNVKEEKFPNYLKKELISKTKFDINHIINVFTWKFYWFTWY